MQEPLRIAPFANPEERSSFLISIPMKRLLLAVRDARQVGAVSEVLLCRIHLAAKLPFENNAIVRHPLRQVVIDLPDQPVVVADIPGHSKQKREHSTGEPPTSAISASMHPSIRRCPDPFWGPHDAKRSHAGQ